MAVGAPEVQTAPPRNTEQRQYERDVRAQCRDDAAELGQFHARECRDGHRPDHEPAHRT